MINEQKKFSLDLLNSIRNIVEVSNVENHVDLLNSIRNMFLINDVLSIDCFSKGQIHSKTWLVNIIEQMNINLGTVFLCAGWYAILVRLIFENQNVKVNKIRSFDLESSCATIAETYNRKYVLDEWKFKATTIDIHKLSYDNFCYRTFRKDGSSVELCETADTVINTSCEHIIDFDKWYEKIPNGKLIVLQTNNFKGIEDHVNCSDTLEEFGQITPLSVLKYEGELDLGQYKRFMRIGYK